MCYTGFMLDFLLSAFKMFYFEKLGSCVTSNPPGSTSCSTIHFAGQFHSLSHAAIAMEDGIV